MGFQGSALTRVGASVLGLAAAATLVTGCSSSGGGSGSGSTSGSSSTQSTGAATSAAGTTAPVAGATSGGSGSIAGLFCEGYKPTDLENLADPSSAQALLDDWDKFASDAPSAIKSQVSDIDKYLHDAVSGNYTALSGESAKISSDAEAIASYYAAHCH